MTLATAVPKKGVRSQNFAHKLSFNADIYIEKASEPPCFCVRWIVSKQLTSKHSNRYSMKPHIRANLNLPCRKLNRVGVFCVDLRQQTRRGPISSRSVRERRRALAPPKHGTFTRTAVCWPTQEAKGIEWYSLVQHNCCCFRLELVNSVYQIPLNLGWAVSIHKAQGKHHCSTVFSGWCELPYLKWPSRST